MRTAAARLTGPSAQSECGDSRCGAGILSRAPSTSLGVIAGLAQNEEASARLDPQDFPATLPLDPSAVHEVIVDRPGDQSLETVADQNIGRRLTRPAINGDAQRMIGTCCHAIVDIRAEMDLPFRAVALDNRLDSNEWGIIHSYAALFHRGLEVILVITFTSQDTGKQLHQRHSPNRAVLVIPGSIARDPDIDVAGQHAPDPVIPCRVADNTLIRGFLWGHVRSPRLCLTAASPS